MARARNIKPAIMDNEELADLEPITRLLFIYLWMLADKEGRLEDRPKRIGAQALPYDPDVPLELDHIHPRSRGGADSPDNLTPACKRCNTSKGAKTLDEWGFR